MHRRLASGFVGLLACFLLTGATRADDREALKRSFRHWLDLKQLNGDSYTYVTTSTRDAGLIHETTTINVRDGVVVERHYEAMGGAGRFHWSEPQDAVGAHVDGAPAKTFDELYLDCMGDTLSLDAADFWVTLDFEQQGLLRTCTSQTHDDLDPVGIQVAWVRFAPR